MVLFRLPTGPLTRITHTPTPRGKALYCFLPFSKEESSAEKSSLPRKGRLSAERGKVLQGSLLWLCRVPLEVEVWFFLFFLKVTYLGGKYTLSPPGQAGRS